MSDIFLLVNLNNYLGGGETLLVRYYHYLKSKKKTVIILCSNNSFIQQQLGKEVNSDLIIIENLEIYYLSKVQRNIIVNSVIKKLSFSHVDTVRIVSFTMKDLYFAIMINKGIKNSSISHLILHVEDFLYLGQTIFDKFLYFLTKKRLFRNKKLIDLNKSLLRSVFQKNGIISMAEVINQIWKKNNIIDINIKNTVPLPTFTESVKIKKNLNNNFKIIWIGRIVDFKIPSLFAMIDFVSDNRKYSLTIIGDGDMLKLKRYVQSKKLSEANIIFLGQVPYNQLGQIITEHSIGYAMGTSLVELAQYKIPVIIALASFTHKVFDIQICGGLFHNQSLGCDGSEILTKNSKDFPTITEAMNQIEYNYLDKSKLCYEFAKRNYSKEINFKKYTDIIENTILFNENIEIPVAPIVRKILRNASYL